MPEPTTVTYARAAELLAYEGPGGEPMALSVRQVRQAVRRGDLERHGSGKMSRITKRSITSYLEGKRGIWQSDVNPAPARSVKSARSTKPPTPKKEEVTTRGIVIPWKKPGRG